MIPAFAPSSILYRSYTSAVGASAARVNMLYEVTPTWATPFQFRGVYDQTTNGNFVYDWIMSNPAEDSFGSSGTDRLSVGVSARAPDGTMTARKLVESSGGGSVLHECHAGYQTNTFGKIKMKLAVVVKAGERTRIRLEIANGGHSGAAGPDCRTFGIRALFDLTNGVVVDDADDFGSGTILGQAIAWTPHGATITALGFGWYLCTLEGTDTENIQSNWGGSIMCSLTLDSGSGAAAESTSYVGNGFAGIYVWRSTLLPSRAFELDNEALFEDFDDNTGIDNADARTEGFNFYRHLEWPYVPVGAEGGPGLAATALTSYSVANSEVSLLHDDSGYNQGLCTIAWDGATGYVGQAWIPPFLWETKARWIAEPDPPGGRQAFWTLAPEMALTPHFWEDHEDGIRGQPTLGRPHTSSGTAAGLSVLNFTHVPQALVRVGARVYGTGIDNVTSVQSFTTTTVTLDKPVVAPGVSANQAIQFEWVVELDFYEDGLHQVLTHKHGLPRLEHMNYNPSLEFDNTGGTIFAGLWLPTTETECGLVIIFYNGIMRGTNFLQYTRTGDNFGSGVGSFVKGDELAYGLIIGGGQSMGTPRPAIHDWVGVWTTGS